MHEESGAPIPNSVTIPEDVAVIHRGIGPRNDSTELVQDTKVYLHIEQWCGRKR